MSIAGDDGLKKLIMELGSEVDSESRAATGGPDAERLYAVARKVLHLERDMLLPGSMQSEASRIERLMQLIEGEEF